MRLKILQWNIWYKEKIENILKTIQEINPDIICLQEATQNSPFNNNIDTAKFVADKLSFHYIFAPAQKFIPEGNITGNAILSRYPLKDSVIGILQTEKKEITDNNLEGRSYIKARIKLDYQELTIVTAHLSFLPFFKDNFEKIEENEKMVSFIKQQKNPIIFAGDFNSPENSDIVNQLSKFMKNIGPDYNKKTWTTKPPFKYKGFEEKEPLKWRLDHIFATKNVKLISSKVIDTTFSDHLPILAEIET